MKFQHNGTKESLIVGGGQQQNKHIQTDIPYI